MSLVERLLPAPDRARRIDGLRRASSQYAATGIGTVRDCMPTPEDYAVLLAARKAGALSTRRTKPWSAAAGTLVMEHGGLAGPEQRARAVALGSPVTIQQPLLRDTAEVEEGFWGAERVARLFPARGRLDLGAQAGAGSEFPVGQFGAVRSVWGMTTRQTVIGVKGPNTPSPTTKPPPLHTTNAARLLGEETLRGTLTPGRLAELTVRGPQTAAEQGHFVVSGPVLAAGAPVGMDGPASADVGDAQNPLQPLPKGPR